MYIYKNKKVHINRETYAHIHEKQRWRHITSTDWVGTYA